jgi:hypothetical protein
MFKVWEIKFLLEPIRYEASLLYKVLLEFFLNTQGKGMLSAIQVQTLDRTGDSGSTPGQALLR